MSTVKRITGLFDRMRGPLSKITSSTAFPKDDELAQAVIQRIEVDGEDYTAPPTYGDHELTCKRLVRRLDWQLKNSGITVEELIKSYPGEVKALLLLKSYERSKSKKESVSLRDRLIAMGFKLIQSGVWILPPTKTLAGLDSQESLKLWFRQEMSKQVGKQVDYVFPFVALVDLKKTVSERRGIRKMPVARTLFAVLSLEEVVPYSHLYATMKSRGLSAKDIVLSGDVPFLASAFADGGDLEGIHLHDLEVGQNLRRLTGAASIDLEGLANLGPDTIAKALDGVVAHPKDFAQRLIVEAQYWMRFLGGTVPS
ncbi:MAG: hypothetical protein JRN27_00300 [Nitrososphaerota archaeon]|nr:hypothetical protein [Nitrososphaerota archaeon]